MKVKDLFKKKNTVLKPQNIVFNDVNLEVTVGQWLGLLSNTKVNNEGSIQIYTHLSAEELRNKTNISNEKFNEINRTFRELLTKVGIDSNEICILDKFDKENFSFNCHLKNENKDAKISLRWGDFIDFLPEFVIELDNRKKVYEYSEPYEDRDYKFQLQCEDDKNVENENSYHRFYSPYSVPITITNDNYKFELNVANEEDLNVDLISRYVFELNNEEKLKEYLLGLSLPIKIDEVYKKICEISLDSIEKYPAFSIKVTQKIDKENSKVTDKIVLKYGKLEEFKITRNGKTIYIDKNNCWRYDNNKIYASENENGDINFEAKGMSKEEILKLNIDEQIKLIDDDIEQVKKLSKTL